MKHLLVVLLLAATSFSQVHGVMVRWTASPTQGVTYRVFRKKSLTASWNRIALGIVGTSYLDRNVIHGVQYWYMCRAYKATSQPVLSVNSNVVSVRY